MSVSSEMLPQGESFVDFERRLGLSRSSAFDLYTAALVGYRERVANERSIPVDDLHSTLITEE